MATRSKRSKRTDEVILFTGFPGFIGARLIPRLLELRPGASFKCLVQEKFQDRWPGFLEREVRRFCQDAGFTDVDPSVVARERDPPYFETLLVLARRPTVESQNGTHP